MDFDCRLTPVVFAELYKTMATPEYVRRFRSRDELETNGLVDAESATLASRYQRMAEWHLGLAREYGDVSLAPWDRLGPWHGQLASWLLTGAGGSSTEMDGVVSAAVHERYAACGLTAPLNGRPVIHGWTLGHEVHESAFRYPAVPALWPADDNVRLAYEGLIEHVVWLRTLSNPLPELASTAVAWRVGAIIDGLARGVERLPAQYAAVLERCRSILDAAQLRRLNDLPTWFVESRNVITHPQDASRRGWTFVTEAPKYQQRGFMDDAIEAVTVFVFRQAASEASNEDSLPWAQDALARCSADLDSAAMELWS